MAVGGSVLDSFHFVCSFHMVRIRLDLYGIVGILRDFLDLFRFFEKSFESSLGFAWIFRDRWDSSGFFGSISIL